MTNFILGHFVWIEMKDEERNKVKENLLNVEMPKHLKFCLEFVQIRRGWNDANGAANCLFEFNTKIIGFH